MQRQRERELKTFEEIILVMGGHLTPTLEDPTQAFNRRQPDEDCPQLFARQTSLLADLKLEIAALKLSTNPPQISNYSVKAPA